MDHGQLRWRNCARHSYWTETESHPRAIPDGRSRGRYLLESNDTEIETNGQRLAAVWIGIAILCSVCAVFGQGAETYKVRLTTVPIDASMMATVAGSGALVAFLTGNALTIRGNFSGLRSPATDAHIHRGPKGIRGPAILDLKVPRSTNGSMSASVTLTPDEIQDLRNSRLYVQINSEGAPEGNLWGWLLR